MKPSLLVLALAIFAYTNAQQDLSRKKIRVRATGAPSIMLQEFTPHPLRIAASDELFDGKLGGVSGARLICNEKSFHAGKNTDKRWRSGNWRAILTTRLQSLWSLVMFQHERDNSTLMNLKDDALWPSWNDFVDGKASDLVRGSGSTQITTFDGKDVIDLFEEQNQAERYAWLGFTPDSEFSETNTINATSSHCDNWMTTRGYGPALNLDVFISTGSIGGDSIEMKPCTSKFALLCVERTADFEGGFTFSMYGKDVGRRRGKAVHPNARKFKKHNGRVSTTPMIDRRRRTTTRPN